MTTDTSFCNLPATVTDATTTPEPRTGITLAVFAAIGRVCGPVNRIGFHGHHGALAVVSVKPLRVADPVLALPMVDAPAEAWRLYRQYYHAVLDVFSVLSTHREAAHHTAAALVPGVAAAFAPYLGAQAAEFEAWLWATLTGEAQG